MTIEIEIDNVVPLPPRAKKENREDVLRLVSPFDFSKCKHRTTIVDGTLAEVTCADCKEKLNPIAVLVALSQEEGRLRRVWANYKAAAQFFKEKGRCKCQHCGKLTQIPSVARSFQRAELEYAIERGNEMPQDAPE